MSLIYVAGPYAYPDPVVNTRNAILAAEEIVKKGHTPYIPHLTMAWHLVVPHETDFWYEYDLKFLPLCDSLFRISGESKGADREVSLAKNLGMDVYYNLEEIPDVY